MEITYLHREDINETKWDACIYQSFNSLVYAYSWYLDEVLDYWDALILDDYKAVMPLPPKRKWGFSYLFPPFFCQQLGIFSNAEITQEMVNAFFLAIPNHFTFIDIQVNIFSKPVLKGFEVMERSNHHLPLIPTYENLYSHYNENTRRNLKKASGASITTLGNENPQAIIAFYRENYSKKTPEIKESDYARLGRLISTCQRMGVLKTWAAYDGYNTLCAGALFVNDHKNVYYLLGGSNTIGKETGAMYCLFDEFIKTHAGQDLVLDFEGSEIEGVARFYKGLGAKEVFYYRIVNNRLPLLVRWLKQQ